MNKVIARLKLQAARSVVPEEPIRLEFEFASFAGTLMIFTAIYLAFTRGAEATTVHSILGVGTFLAAMKHAVSKTLRGKIIAAFFIMWGLLNFATLILGATH